MSVVTTFRESLSLLAVSAVGAPHALPLDGAAAVAGHAVIGWLWLHTREHGHAVADR